MPRLAWTDVRIQWNRGGEVDARRGRWQLKSAKNTGFTLNFLLLFTYYRDPTFVVKKLDLHHRVAGRFLVRLTRAFRAAFPLVFRSTSLPHFRALEERHYGQQSLVCC